jgi:hypothetical protein
VVKLWCLSVSTPAPNLWQRSTHDDISLGHVLLIQRFLAIFVALRAPLRRPVQPPPLSLRYSLLHLLHQLSELSRAVAGSHF